MSRRLYDLMVILSLLIIVCNSSIPNTISAFEEFPMDHEVSEKEAKQVFREMKEKLFEGE